MKSTLTSDDPSGWYLCRRIHAKHLCCNWWDREHLRSSPLLGELNLSLYEDFRRLFTESDVAALLEELTALRDELKNMTCKKQIAMDAVQSAGGSIAELEAKPSDLEKHKNGVLDHNHQLLQEVESLKQQLSDSESHKNQIIEIARRAENRHRERINKCWDEFQTLREELSRLKSYPYEMRRADTPDCEGLWLRIDGDRRCVRCVVTLNCEFSPGPWFYLGPIPVIPVEQQPPKVVKVRCKKTGQVCRAIPSPCGKWQAMIGDDGSFLGNESVDNWEEVQS